MFFLSCFISCSQSNEQVDIITSCYPIYDFTTHIVKNKLSVKNFTKPGTEVHDYEPSSADMRKLSDCKLFLVNGLGLEHYTSSLPESIAQKTKDVNQNIEIIYNNNIEDPHIWLDISNAITMMENIKNEIIKIDSSNTDFYEENFQNSKANFLSLKQQYEENLKALSSRYLLTSHNAFSYLCNEFDLIQISINGLSNEDEPTPETMANIIKEIKEKNIKTIFYEKYGSDTIATSLAKQLDLEVDVLNPLESYNVDNGENYISEMENNLKAIVKALR